jgi:hypothetical protein
MDERAIKRARQILWYRGDLSWKLHAGQLKIEDAFQKRPGNLFVADCARQFGKTVWCAVKDVEFALKRKKANIRVGTAFLTDLEQYIIPAFEWVMEDMPDALRPRWQGQKYRYYFPTTDSEIRLVGLDRKPNGLRGNKVNRLDLQEAGFISNLKHLYEYVFIPLTTHVPDAEIIMTSTQPDSPDHDFNEFCDLAMDQGCYIQLDIDQNPLLSQERRDAIALKYAPNIPGASREQLIALGRASIVFQREYLCRRIVDKDKAIVPEWFNSPEFIFDRPKTEYDQFYHRYLWMDIGVQKDLTVVLFVLYDFKGAYAYVEDEIVIRGPKVTTKIIRDAIRAKLEERPEYKKSYRRIADNSHPLLLNDLATDPEFPLYFTATDKARLHEMVNELRIFVGARRLKAHPRCTHFIGSMASGIWDKNRKEFARSPIHGHADAIAAAVYGVRNLDLNTNPIPQNYGVDLENSFMALQKPRLSATAKTLKEAFARRKR